MKAAILEHYGSPEEFKIKDIPVPAIKEGQLLIQNKASSVNPIDTLVRQGILKLITGMLGDQLIGSDFSGTVIESQSARFKAGDEVFGVNNAIKGGSYAEVIVANENNTALKPVNLNYTEAAVLPLAGLTAWQALVQDGKLKNGYRVLITGCTGGVGCAAVQIAKTFNAAVTGTGREQHTAFAKSIGVDKVINYDKEEIPKDMQFDLIFDASGNFTISDMKHNLTSEAIFVSTRGGAHGLKGTAEAIIDVAFQKRMKIVRQTPNPEDLNKLKELVENGQLKPYIAKVFSLQDLPLAHHMVENGGFTGKVAIDIQKGGRANVI